MKRTVLLALGLLLLATLACSSLVPPEPIAEAPVTEVTTLSPTLTLTSEATVAAVNMDSAADLEHSALVNIYDPARDPADDLNQAIVLAQKENKRIMLEMGGNWCIWCKHMDDFYTAHADLLQYRTEHYVLVKVNVSTENSNEEFLSQYPEVAGYPHIFILDSDGTFMHSQNTGELEDGANSYVLDVFMAFLQKWALTQ